MRHLRAVLILFHVLAISVLAFVVQGGPVQAYLGLTGSTPDPVQFRLVDRAPAWLVVELETQGQWRTIYQSRSDEHTWLRPYLDQVRMRTVVDGFGRLEHRKSYDALGVWLARRAAVDFPQAQHLRVRIDQPGRDGEEPVSHWVTRYSLDKYR
ncbi:MAG: hypothetical protein GXP62_11110 [Oligoflexia bacterium]|nr:hypothetical protein [Oligoflexia bacterium]